MGGVFSKPKIPKAPVTPPMPKPEIAEQAGEAEMKKQRQRRGWEFSVGRIGNLQPMSGLKTTLG